MVLRQAQDERQRNPTVRGGLVELPFEIVSNPAFVLKLGIIKKLTKLNGPLMFLSARRLWNPTSKKSLRLNLSSL